MNKLYLGCALTVLGTSSAFAQSTGSAEIENQDTIVVTGSRLSNGVAGVVIPDVPKTRTVLTQEFISHQGVGQSILNTINQIPGVNFTNSDPYGSSGGNLRIRGFPGNRIALLFDGLPLNDTGSYAIYSNQQLDPEVIDQVTVNLGTTDVDSPTPSAAGGVVSYRTRLPSETLGAMVDASLGDFDFTRIFGMLDTGTFTKFGTRAFVSASNQRYEKFNGAPGELNKTQYNFRIFQPIGSSGDFVSVAGHYNENRNASYNTGTAADFSLNRDFDNIGTCVRDTPTRGVIDNENAGTATNNATPASCTNYYGLRINPSNTGNVRVASRFTLADGLILTVDPGYQYTLANGGGTNVLAESSPILIGRSTASGVDLNGDGDFRDSIRVYTPSNTRTNRYTLLSSLIYEINDAHRVRLAYTYDRGEHRQTGEQGFVDPAGNPISVFGGKYNQDARIVTADGLPVQSRDRYSIAMLQQISGEYFGTFLEDRLTLTAGVRAPFFKRDLNQYCFTQVSTGNVICTSQPVPTNVNLVATNYAPPSGQAAPSGVYYAPYERTVKYSPILPSAGITFKIAGPHSLYASFGRNFSAPSTDNLYRSVAIAPLGEKTDAYEGGYRYRSSKVQAQLAGYWTDYQNRIVSATDTDPGSPTYNTSVDRNVGSARAYGFDFNVAVQPIPQLSLSPFVSYINSRIKNDVTGINGAIISHTQGAQFVETPKWQFGGRVDVDLTYVSFGAQAKHVGGRYSTDDNGRTLTSAGRLSTLTGIDTDLIAADGRTKGYTLIDLDARVSLAPFGLERTYLSVRVDNVFDEDYLGNISTTQSTLASQPRFRIGSPRTFQGTLRFAF
ncbi:MAG: TonB-dependent receptor [Sphingomonas bacterium]|nr:TonB-dependent receptor [Sphingomonas bacterium]MDB5688940.1 TonB-dependent receptor [Sphingomonas bacterium]